VKIIITKTLRFSTVRVWQARNNRENYLAS